jgi:hypothetical protein
MSPLADTRCMPLETAAAVYEANGADRDFMAAWMTTGGTRWAARPLEDYRTAAETLSEAGFALLFTAYGLEQVLTAATDRVRRTVLPGIPRAALDALTGIYMALMAPDWELSEPAPLHLIHALEDTCEAHGVITGRDRVTCVHARRAADCCA